MFCNNSTGMQSGKVGIFFSPHHPPNCLHPTHHPHPCHYPPDPPHCHDPPNFPHSPLSPHPPQYPHILKCKYMNMPEAELTTLLNGVIKQI